ncbi:glycosyltransferase [Parvularcula marina]|uniref:glycosyltransferase n=1 Tax=Parvularcula marina TaxID=2292771 RepID=UPI003559E0F5
MTGFDRMDFRMHMDNHPKVSVITVVYNNAAMIERCIRSVTGQSYPNIEYIVIDGASTDGTQDIIQNHLEHIDVYISEPDGGIYDAMNKGIGRATGDYICFLNSDDFYLRHAVSASLSHVQEHGLDLAYSGMVFSEADGRAVVADEPRPWDESLLIQGMPGGHETILAHRRCYEKIGVFDLSYRLAADYHWVTRAFLAGFKARPLNRNNLVMTVGGESFNEAREFSENIRIMMGVFPDLTEEQAAQLYQLKYYKHWQGCTISDRDMITLYGELPDNPLLKKATYKTIEERKRTLRGKILPLEQSEEGKLKIAICLTFLTNISGGAERIAIEAANELAARGHAVTVVCCHAVAGEPYFNLDSAIPYIDLAIPPYKKHYEALGSGFDISFEDWCSDQFNELGYSPTIADFEKWKNSGHLWRTRMFHAFLKENDFDVVISHMPSTFPYVLFGRDKADTAFHLAILHNAPRYKFFSELYPADSLMDRHMRLASLQNADSIGVLFEEFIDQMPERYREKCVLTPNFTSQAIVEEKKPRSRILLSVGRLVPQKGHEILLHAYSQIIEQQPDWKLHIYGEGPLEQELRELCRELHLPEDDIFKGTTADIAAVYAEADLFVFPSVFEGFGLTVIEAMCAGVPCVAFDDCDGVRFLVDSTKNGLLVARDEDGSNLARAVISLIEDDDLRADLSRGAIATARKYSVEHSVDSLESIFPPPQDQSDVSSAHGAAISPKRIAVVTSYTDGGAGNAAMRLHDGLVSIGEQSRVLTFTPSEEQTSFVTGLSATEYEVLKSFNPLQADHNRLPSSTIFTVNSSGIGKKQLEFLEAFDVINLHWVSQLLSVEGVAYLASLGKPVVWTLHDMNAFTGGCHYSNVCDGYTEDCRDCPQLLDTWNDYPSRVLEAKKHHWPEHIVIVSPSKWLADVAASSAVFSNHRIEVIPNSLNTDIFRPIDKGFAREQLGLPADRKILLFTCHSHHERRKGFAELLRTAELLRKQDEAYHIVTLGHATEALLGVGIPYTSLGYIADQEKIAQVYAAADVTVLPTLEDNLPNVILESASCGTPTVAFAAGGVKDAVIEGITGFTVPVGDCEGLARQIQNAALRDDWTSCRQYAEENFALEVQAKRYAALFDELSELPLTREEHLPSAVFAELAETKLERLAEQAVAAHAEIQVHKKSLDDAKLRATKLEAQCLAEKSRADAARHDSDRLKKVLLKKEGSRSFLSRLMMKRKARIIRQSECFDADWYGRQYQDIGSSGIDPALHYLRYGWLEGRQPGPNFDSNQYLRDHDDVASSGMNPLLHYLQHGEKEGRIFHPLRHTEY